MTRALTVAVVSFSLAGPARGQEPSPPTTYAITNATIVPVTGPAIERGTVVVRDGKIAAVGPMVPVPPGARIIEGAGLFVYPGLIDGGSRLGLTEIGSVPGGEDTQELGSFNPHDLALTAVNPHSEHIPVTRVNGITSVITSARGGLIQGYAALIDLDGWTPDQMAELPRAAMVMTYPRLPSRRFGRVRAQPDGNPAETLNRQVKELRQYLENARAYAAVARHQQVDLPFEALAPVMRGEAPVIFDVETADQIRGALALADSFHLTLILRGAREAWRLADTLAARRIPVIVGPLTELPDGDDPYDAIYANPGVLAKAGVVVAFQTNDAGDARNLPYNAALATAYGLDPDEALRALTINPARIFGVADRLGSIEVGKVANLQVTTGDPLDVRTQVRHVFVRGVDLPFEDRHTRLYQAFRARPRPTPPR